MIALDSQPFSIVEDRGFLRLLAYVSLRYITPSRKYFSDKEMYATLRDKTRQDFHSDGKYSLLALPLIFGLVMVVNLLLVGLHTTSHQSLPEKNEFSRFILFLGPILQMPLLR